MTDYDRLIIEVLTDGTIEPDDALAEAARILMTQAQVFAGFTQGESDQASAAGPGNPGRNPEQAAPRSRTLATRAQCAAQPADRASRPGSDSGSRATPLDSQLRSALADRIAAKTCRVRISAGRRNRAWQAPSSWTGLTFRTRVSMSSMAMFSPSPMTRWPRRLHPFGADGVGSGNAAGGEERG